VAGQKWNQEYSRWDLITEEVKGSWMKKDGKDIRGSQWLTIRDYNFQFAAAKTKTVEEALKYAEEKLCEMDGTPKYLPDLLAMNEGLSLDKKHYSYSKILNDLEKDKLQSKN